MISLKRCNGAIFHLQFNDLLDVCRGFCAIAPFGDFRDGNVCLPSLGVSIPVCPGKY